MAICTSPFCIRVSKSSSPPILPTTSTGMLSSFNFSAGSGVEVKDHGTVLMTVSDKDKDEIVKIAHRLNVITYSHKNSTMIFNFHTTTC
jgi:hypothetical protein